MPKFHILAVQALHVLTAKWRDYVTSEDDLLTDLSPVEQLLIYDAQAISNQITVQEIQVHHPYLSTDHAQRMFDTLVEKQALEPVGEDTYRYAARARKHVSAVEAAMQAYFKVLQVLPPDKADRLAVLMMALIDGIAAGPNPVPTPIFYQVASALMPTEYALGQVQQRLIALLTYRDDVHIAAWTSEGYSPVAVRVATHLFNNIEMQPLSRFLEIPIYYDEDYVRTGLEELQKAGDVVEIAGSYQLSVKGATRRERVEHLTSENFDAAFQNHFSPESQASWVELMTVLVEAGHGLLTSNRPSGDSPSDTFELPKT